jgi:ketosteroid isomerase-like protein
LNSESPETLAEVLGVLAAEREITRVLHRYCHAVDRHDMQELLSVYHPDAADEHGSYSGDAEGFVAYLDERMPRVYEATMHALSNISIDVRGDVAFTESYVTASHVIRPELGGGLFWFAGRYIDRFEKRSGEWRIAHRRLLRTWEKVEPAARALDGGVALPDPSPHTDGLRTREDPSYARG